LQGETKENNCDEHGGEGLKANAIPHGAKLLSQLGDVVVVNVALAHFLGIRQSSMEQTNTR